MADRQLLEYITHGREERNLEYKRTMNWSAPHTKAKIAKSVMAMANIRDGGVIVFGIGQQGERFIPEGMNTDDLDSFKQDDVMERVNEYADPYVELSVTSVEHEGRFFIVIQVQEFSEVPVVCKKTGEEALRRGAIFTRTRRKYEAAEVPSQAEMREIIDAAVDKSGGKLVQRWAAVGLPAQVATVSDEDKFRAQRGDL